MSNDVFLRDLETWLDDEAGSGAPDYLGQVLDGVNRTSQQPAWSSLERWLRIDLSSAGRWMQLRRLAWVVVIGAVLAALVAAAVLVGAWRNAPPPFGLAPNGQIAIANLTSIVVGGEDGSEPRQLVAAPDGVEALAWSPDGMKLAFRTLGPESRVPTILVVNADGTGVVDVAIDVLPPNLYDEPLAWSPDSTQLVTPSQQRDLETALAIVKADGSGTRLILDDEPAAGMYRFSVAWSPDGEWIAFIGRIRATGETRLYVVHPDGTGERRVADIEPDAEGIAPAWAPDPNQSRLLVGRAGGGISVVDIQTGGETQLAPSRGIWPAWSPDARGIAWWDAGFVVGDTARLVAGEPARRLTVGSTSCDRSGPTDPNLPCGPPAWSPDGRLLFAPSGPGWTVVVVHVDGSADPIVIPLKQGVELNPFGSATWQRAGP